MKKTLTLLALLLALLVGCSNKPTNEIVSLYDNSFVEIEPVGAYYDNEREQVYGFSKSRLRELTDEEIDFYINSSTLVRNNFISEDWIVFEMDHMNSITQDTKQYLETFNPIVLQGYKTLYTPQHIEVSDTSYKLLLPKALLEEEKLLLFFNESIVIGLT